MAALGITSSPNFKHYGSSKDASAEMASVISSSEQRQALRNPQLPGNGGGYLGKDEVKIVACGRFYTVGKSVSLNEFAERAARGYCPGHRERQEST